MTYMLRPIDIQNKEFDKKLKGYDCDAVDDFLDVVIQDFEQLYKENTGLKDRISVLTETVERYKAMEKTIQKSLDTARQTAAELRNSAEIEARAIISKAKLDASRLSQQIDGEHMKKQHDIKTAQAEIDSYKMRVKALCESVSKIMDTI